MINRRSILAKAAAGALLASLLAGGAAAEGLKFGFSQVTLQSPFYVQLRDGAVAAAKSSGDELVFSTPMAM